MNNLILKKVLFAFFILVIISGQGNAQIFHKKNPEKQLFGKTHLKTKEAKVKQPKSVLRAKKKQESNDRRLKKANEKAVKQSQKRSVEIQTPEVQERMKQNKKDLKVRDKGKHRRIKSGTKSARKKYD